MTEVMFMLIGLILVIGPLLISTYIKEKSGWFGTMYVSLICLGAMFLYSAGLITGRSQGLGFPIAMQGIVDGGAFTTLGRTDVGEYSYFTVKSARQNILLLRGSSSSPNLKTFVLDNEGRMVEFK